MTIIKDNTFLLEQINQLLNCLKKEQYTEQLKEFNGSTLGMHFRHIIEFYIAIKKSDKNDIISYDKRKRDILLESDTVVALNAITEISIWLKTINHDKTLQVETSLSYENEEYSLVKTSLVRELMYAFDHAVHHLAIIKIGLQLNFPAIPIDENLGIAPSTVKHLKACAQ